MHFLRCVMLVTVLLFKSVSCLTLNINELKGGGKEWWREDKCHLNSKESLIFPFPLQPENKQAVTLKSIISAAHSSRGKVGHQAPYLWKESSRTGPVLSSCGAHSHPKSSVAMFNNTICQSVGGNQKIPLITELFIDIVSLLSYQI